MKNLIILLLTTTLFFQSCGNEAENKATEIPQTIANGIPTEFMSPLRPNEKLELGKVYTDTIKYVEFDDNGDNWLVVVEKNNDTIGLIYDKEQSDFFRGEEIEIKWKIDSIRYAGDPEFLNHTAGLKEAKRIKSFKLTDKKINFFWKEMQYLEDLEGDFNVIVLNEEYIKNISDPEKAALSYIATFVGNECEWAGKAIENRSNLKCKIIWALDLGYQCSYEHLSFLRFWFRNNKDILNELKNCPTTPDGATVQDTFDEINVEIQGNMITVFFKANGINIREGKSCSWTEKHYFEFKKNELLFLKKDISAMERGTVDVRGN